MVRYIGRCGACKQTSARDYTETRTEIRHERISMGFTQKREATYFVRIVQGGREVRPSKDYECPRCGALRWEGKRVEGTLTGRKCDPRCTNAKGFRCECSCAGKNHGGAHLVCEAVAA